MKQRNSGQGGLVKKSGSKFWFTLIRDENGRQRCKSTGFTQKNKAEGVLQRLLGQRAIGQLPPPDATKLTYDNLRNRLLQDYEIHHHRSLYIPAGKSAPILTQLKHLDKEFSGRKANSITSDAVLRFTQMRQKADAADATINRSLAALKRMFHLAVQDGKISTIPFIPMLKEASPRTGFLEQDDFRRLRSELPERLRPVATIGFYNGLRRGELQNLKWDRVNLVDSTINLNPEETKNSEKRTSILNPETVAMLRMLPQTGPYVFGGEKPLGNFTKAWQSACIRAGLGQWEIIKGKKKYVGQLFHDLRRSSARNFIRADVPEQTAMRLMGHKTRSVFTRYNIINETDLRDATRKRDEYFARKDAESVRSDEGLMRKQQIQ